MSERIVASESAKAEINIHRARRADMHWVPLSVEISADGTFGLTYGVTAIATETGAPSSQLRLGKYFSAWRRVGSEWRIIAHAEVGLVELPEGFAKPVIPPIPGGNASDFTRADGEFAGMAGRDGAAKAFATFVAADGVIFSGSGELIRGPEAVRAQMEDGPQAGREWHPVAAGSSAAGDLGFTVGEAVITPTGSPATFGMYLSLWRRTKDGKIRFIADGGNARPAK